MECAFLWQDRARQLIDFSTLSWGNIHPTDIDAVMEFDGQKLILMEYKSNGKQSDKGQQLVLQRIADSWCKSSPFADAIVLYANHNSKASEVVDGGEATVTQMYWKGRLLDYKEGNHTVREMVLRFAHSEIERKTGCSQLKP